MTKYWLKLTVMLYILWVMLSGRFEAKFLIVGLVTAALIAFVCLPSLNVTKGEGAKSYPMLDIRIGAFVLYMLWLTIEIVKASLSVAIAIVSPKMTINPHIIDFYCRYENPIATTLLINSIILTPGTVTVDIIDDSHFYVHALTDKAAAGMLEGRMQKRIGKVFKEKVEIKVEIRGAN